MRPNGLERGRAGFRICLAPRGGYAADSTMRPTDPAPARQLAGDRHIRDDGPLARVVERFAPVDEPAVALERVPPHGRVDQLPPHRGLGVPRGVAKCRAASTRSLLRCV